MIRTAYGTTNTRTGEITDLSPLRYKPRGRVSRPKSTYGKRGYTIHISEDAAIAVGLWTILLVVLATY